MADNSFSKLVPGFDFLQGLVKNAGPALPGMGQWVSPTLNPEELGKRIEELRTVQFWLEQNAKLLGATIQAMEVQRMTLSTLQSMNVPLADLSNALKLPTAEAALKPAAKAAPAAAKVSQASAAEAAPPPASPAAAAVDPLQWWGALSQQFTQLAANAMQDSGADAAKKLAATLAQPASKPAAKKSAKPK